MTYILENNGVYGLTKGQFSATADTGSKSKRGVVNADARWTRCPSPLSWARPFVARSSPAQGAAYPLVKAAIATKAPPSSTSSALRRVSTTTPARPRATTTCATHNEAVNRLDFWPSRESINVEYNEGDAIEVPQHDGSIIRLRKTHPDYDPTDRVQALEYVAHHAAKGEVVTGLLYLDTKLRRPPRPPQYRGDPVQQARREGACPGAGIAGEDKRGS